MNMRVSLAVVSVAASSVWAQQVRHAGDGWSLALPDGWAAIDDETMGIMNEMLVRSTGNTESEYVAGYTDPAIWPNGEYVLIQVNQQSFTGASERDVINSFGALEASEAELSDRVKQGTDGLVSSLDIGTVVYEPESKRILMRFSIVTEDTLLQGYSVIHPGMNKSVQLNWYAPDSEFEASASLFDESSRSFAWDSGQAWVPSTTPGGASRILLYAIIGGASGLIGSLILRKKRVNA